MRQLRWQTDLLDKLALLLAGAQMLKVRFFLGENFKINKIYTKQ